MDEDQAEKVDQSLVDGFLDRLEKQPEVMQRPVILVINEIKFKGKKFHFNLKFKAHRQLIRDFQIALVPTAHQVILKAITFHPPTAQHTREKLTDRLSADPDWAETLISATITMVDLEWAEWAMVDRRSWCQP